MSRCLIALLCLGLGLPLLGQESTAKPELELAHFRVLSPIALKRPFLADEGRESWKITNHFDRLPLDLGRIDEVQFRAHSTARETGIGWSDRDADLDGWLELGDVRKGAGLFFRPRNVELGAAITFVEPKSFVSVEIEAWSQHPFRLRVDGKIVATKLSSEAGDSAPGSAKKTLHLTPARHAILIEALRDPSLGATCKVRAVLRGEAVAREEVDAEKFLHGNWVAPRLDLPHYLDVPAITGVSISTGGRYVAVSYADPATPADDRERWTEIRDAETWNEVLEIREAIGFTWTEEEGEYFYRRRQAKGQVIRLGVIGGLEADASAPLEGIVEVHRLLPGFVVTLRHEEKKKDERDVRRWRGPWDRADSFRAMHRVWWIRDGGPMRFDPRDAGRTLLAAGESALSVQDVDEDRGVILLARPDRTMKERPFSRTELWEISVDGESQRKLLTPVWFRSARYAAGAERLLITAGVSAFGDTGRDPKLPEGVIANDYDTQVYWFETRGDDPPRSLSRTFDPAIEQARFNPMDRKVYVSARVGTEIGLFRIDPEDIDARFERVDFDRLRPPRDAARPLEVIAGFEIEPSLGRLVLRGSGARLPQTVMVIDSDRGTLQRRTLGPWVEERPDYRYEDRFSVALPTVQDFDVEMEDGTLVKGRVHLPSRYESRFRYPAIVYYYAGTVPTDRSFGGRYPKNYWAEKGYIVYVLTPSGATGFGQEMSARHVNDWGDRSQKELIACTEAFLDAWRCVDRDRVGCIGASYGGFTTMSLMTRTDLFRTGIAHAGISSLASYWGEGYWGYLYSAVATAGKYPWNAPDLYVDRSALFRADKLSGSMLLLHGDADTNVPPGESRQLYTALKLLDKPVEYLEFHDEDHHILHLPRRRLWAQSIVAWFDRELKGESAWWDHLYPDGTAK